MIVRMPRGRKGEHVSVFRISRAAVDWPMRAMLFAKRQQERRMAKTPAGQPCLSVFLPRSILIRTDWVDSDSREGFTTIGQNGSLGLLSREESRSTPSTPCEKQTLRMIKVCASNSYNSGAILILYSKADFA